MKRLIIIFLAILPCALANAQMDTLHIGDRNPTYYYWDTNWWDHYCMRYSPYILGNSNWEHLPITKWTVYNDKDSRVEVTRCFVTDTPLTVIGLAGTCVRAIVRPYLLDQDTSHCLPEYFSLYNNDMEKLRQVRWDTATPKHLMAMEYWPHHETIDQEAGIVYHDQYEEAFAKVYEAYFETPVVVSDTFFIGGTQNNNYYEAYWYEIWFDTILYRDHDCDPALPFTAYVAAHSGYETEDDVSSKPPIFRFRAHLIDSCNSPMLLTGLLTDTNWHEVTLYGNFLGLFPIFDTSSVPAPDSSLCIAPQSLRLTNMSSHSVTLIWAGPDNRNFELRLQKDSAEAQYSTHTVNFATITDIDSLSWYTAKVRSICDSGIVSDWCDSIRFFIPGDTSWHQDIDTTVSLSLADKYTYIMPNPANKQVTVASSFPISKIEIYASDGTLVKATNEKGISISLNLSNLSGGLYLVRVSTAAGVSTKKLIIQN